MPGLWAQVGMLGVILSAIFVIMVGYLMVGISGYLAYPTTVQGNVLKNISTDAHLMQARIHAPCMHPCSLLGTPHCYQMTA